MRKGRGASIKQAINQATKQSNPFEGGGAGRRKEERRQEGRDKGERREE